eukprot:340044-Chlamydomonas_euryale.AAC.1
MQPRGGGMSGDVAEAVRRAGRVVADMRRRRLYPFINEILVPESETQRLREGEEWQVGIPTA